MSSPQTLEPQERLIPCQPQSELSEHHRTVFDIGMNNGDDSAYYLSNGFRVIAVEANPILVERARGRFQPEISSGQLVLEGVGIAEKVGAFPFWVNDERSVFSSFERGRAVRNGMKCHAVEVECVTFDTLLAKYGTPYYMKIDVEGAERFCLASMSLFSRPKYVSVEAEEFEYLQLLWQLGYREFAIVDQMRHNSTFADFSNDTIVSRVAKQACSYADRFKNRFSRVGFSRGSSGPFGEDTHAQWHTFEEVAYEWLHFYFGYRNRGRLNPSSWYDFHARDTANPETDCKEKDFANYEVQRTA